MSTVTVVEAVREVLITACNKPVYILDSDASNVGDLILLTPYEGQIIGDVDVCKERIQVRVACTTFAESYRIGWAAFNALNNAKLTNTDRAIYGAVVPLQPPFLFQKDEQQRVVYLFNIYVAAGTENSVI